MYKNVLNQILYRGRLYIQLRHTLFCGKNYDYVFPEIICSFFGIDHLTTVLGHLTRSILMSGTITLVALLSLWWIGIKS